MNNIIRGAVIGYGGTLNMGKSHAFHMRDNGIQFVAACDIDPVRSALAKEDFPHIESYTRAQDMLAREDIDLVSIVTPHHVHADIAREVIAAGKHCVIEKPMCIRADDAFELVELAKAKGVMLSVYHNRRWDGWYMTVQDLIAKGILGDIYNVQMFFGEYGHPGSWWRADKTISGGVFYDWGAHYIDWLLTIVPGPIRSVRGFIHNRVWHDISNEDEIESLVEFESGAVAHVQVSNIARARRAPVVIQGTKGSVVVNDLFKNDVTLYTDVEGLKVESKIYTKSDLPLAYYGNIREHLLNGAPLAVRPEEAARNIALIETTERSALKREPLPLACDANIGVPAAGGMAG
ncbi:Gfo/Idh/MocA family protein [Paenibacillus sacheonensis]|uniref:Gfo/Idh/MocA family oxidoreductase n=1 Tax=Paenibacillus sacheonensis TaxID=742054 RepID=A0A7X4YT51_9BACL|nr:Gfo/Idh/MocA family oxidoreductase [Paenibacillus sacheonensis]MBM7568384.1 putative dehydrogenase [Paenibacillus sacheonensis]NBC72083.1 Gfo/Idh/MocA family oxidoreductase [Paenibacillus sacheonensis]